MTCPHCGYVMTAFDANCPRCGKSPSQSPQPTNTQSIPAAPPPTPGYAAPSYPNQGRPYPNGGNAVQTRDEPDRMMGFLGFLVPLAGFIIYFVSKDQAPGRARSALHGALYGIGSGFVVTMILIILGGKVAQPFADARNTMAIDQRASLEQEVLNSYNDDLARKNTPIRATRLVLVQQTDKLYVGTVTLTTGAQLKMTVTVDGERLYYETTLP